MVRQWPVTLALVGVALGGPAITQAQALGATLVVFIHDTAGRPITHARLFVMDRPWGATTDSSGLATLGGLEPEFLFVQAAAVGYTSQGLRVDLDPERQPRLGERALRGLGS